MVEGEEAVAVMSVTGCGTRRMRVRRCVASVSSFGASGTGGGAVVDTRVAWAGGVLDLTGDCD